METKICMVTVPAAAPVPMADKEASVQVCLTDRQKIERSLSAATRPSQESERGNGKKGENKQGGKMGEKGERSREVKR